MDKPGSVAAAEKFLDEFFAQNKSGTAANTGEPAPAEKEEETPVAKEGVEGAEEANTEETPVATPEEDEKFKHKYDVLNGKYKTEVPALHGKVRELEAELRAFKEMQLAATTPRQEEKIEDSRKKINETYEALAREYGTEFVEHQRNLSRMEAEAIVSEKMRSLNEKLDKVAEISSRTAENDYLEDLTKRAPHWQATKDDPEFHAWLSETDEFSGVRRFDLAREAMLRGDSARVAVFYNAFKPAEKTPSPKNSTPKKVADKNRLVAPPSVPGGSMNRTEGAGDEAPIRSSDLARFARDVIANKYVGRESEMRSLQQKYDAAQAAGKIVMD